MSSLDGQVVLITGAGTGLGRGLVDCFREEGARVGALEISREKCDALRREVDGSSIVVCEGDVRSREDNERAVATVVDRFGALDTFVQCAGITDWTPAFQLIEAEKLTEAFDQVMHVNLLGPLLGAMCAVPALRESRGAMIFTLSTSGFFPGGQGALYTLSKHALNGLVRQLAYELAPEVRVNGVVPGAIKESRIGGPPALQQEDLYPEKLMPNIGEVLEQTSLRRVYPTARDYGSIYTLLADRDRARLATGSIVFWDSGISLTGHGTAVLDSLHSQE